MRISGFEEDEYWKQKLIRYGTIPHRRNICNRYFLKPETENSIKLWHDECKACLFRGLNEYLKLKKLEARCSRKEIHNRIMTKEDSRKPPFFSARASHLILYCKISNFHIIFTEKTRYRSRAIGYLTSCPWIIASMRIRLRKYFQTSTCTACNLQTPHPKWEIQK